MNNWNLIQIGDVYVTSDETNTGTKYICETSGTDVLEFGFVANDIRALDGTVYNQQADIVDIPITLKFPLLETSMKDAIKEVFQTYYDTDDTPFDFVLTGPAGTFTMTAKPAWTPRPIEYPGTFQNGKLLDVTMHVYGTLVAV